MATRRKRPVLYEVMRRSQPRDSASRRRSAAPAAAPTGGTASPAPTAVSASADRPRAIRIADGRLYAVLGWPGLGVLAVGTVFILWVMFQAGERYARSQFPAGETANRTVADSAATDVEGGGIPSADHRPADGGTVATPTDPVTEAPAPASPSETGAAEPQPTFEFKPGYHYVVIQHFYKSRQADAVSAARYLRANGVSCVVTPRTRDVELIATAPFLLRQEDVDARAAERQRCDALKRQIKQIGREYAREHGYAFDQCYERLLLK